MTENKGLKYVGSTYGYRLYENSEGFIEGYKSIHPDVTHVGNRFAKNINRIVTFATTREEFEKWLNQNDKPPVKKYDPYQDEKQTQIPMN